MQTKPSLGGIVLYDLKKLLRSPAVIVIALLLIPFLLFHLSALNRLLQFRAIPSFIPYRILGFFNLFFPFIGIFFTLAVFEDTGHAIRSLYPRPFGNREYIWGSMRRRYSFFSLSPLGFPFADLIFHLVFVNDVPVRYGPYLFYPFLINLPTVFFICGLSALWMTLFQSPAITYTVLPAHNTPGNGLF